MLEDFFKGKIFVLIISCAPVILQFIIIINTLKHRNVCQQPLLAANL